jgi:succinate dehydrogenase hydrophobic anchor subunit
MNNKYITSVKSIMLQRFTAVFLILVMVHCTVYITFSQYKGNKVNIVMVEEEETSHSDSSSKFAENQYMYIYTHHRAFSILSIKNNDFNKENGYYTLHHKETGLKPPPDYPPEV